MASEYDHTDLTLVFKVSFGNDARRITYPKGRLCNYDGLRGTIERLFHLSASPFFIAFTDDDGDENAIKSPLDLSEAIVYFASGSDPIDGPCSDTTSSYTSSTSSSYDSAVTGGGSGGAKVTLRVHVVVEYDGPSLSDAGSVLNFNASEEGSSRGGVEWGEGRDTRSRSSWTSGSSQSWRQEDDVPAGTRVVIEEDDDWDDEPIDLTRDPFLPGHNGISNHIPAPTSPHPLSQAHYPESARSSSSPSSRSSASPSPTRSYASSSHHNTQGNVPRTDHDLQSSSPASQISFNHRDSRASFDQPPSHSSDRFSSPLTPSDPRTISSDHLPALSSHHSQVSATDPEDSKRSDFSARWVKEQTALLARRNNPNPLSIVSSSSSSSSFTSSSRQSSSSRSADGDDDEPNRSSLAISTSDLGSLELQQDDRGRWYYAYTTSSPLIPQSDSSRNSPSDTHPRHQQLEQQPDPQLSLVSLHPSSSHPFMSSSKGKAAASSSRPTSVGSSRQLIGSTDQRWLDTFDSALGSEISDVVPCSGCGIEIGYMRYTCIVCGPSCSSSSPSSIDAGDHHHHSQHQPTNGHDLSWDISPSELEDDGYSSDTTQHVSSRPSFSLQPKNTSSRCFSNTVPTSSSGFDLCVSCIESLGAAHARSHFRRSTAPLLSSAPGGGRPLNHAFRERVWEANAGGRTGGAWKDVEYEDDVRCSTCDAEVDSERYKCLSCQTFNLCKLCFHKVADIHPIHAFLSVPTALERRTDDGETQAGGPDDAVTAHPGAFCHNCLRSIVGARFHCAICPSWDLCQACESIPPSILFPHSTSPHQPNHIMIKLPVPRGPAETEEISRQARERWGGWEGRLAANGSGGRLPLLLEGARSRDDRRDGRGEEERQVDPLPLARTRRLTDGERAALPIRGVLSPAPPPSASRSVNKTQTSTSKIRSLGRAFASFGRSSSPRQTPGSPSRTVVTNAPTALASNTTVYPPQPAQPIEEDLPPRGHNIPCSSCHSTIYVGPRFECLNCPTKPEGVNLCVSCEPISHLIHNSMHVFAQLDRPVDFELSSRSPFLPVLYLFPAGTARDPNAFLDGGAAGRGNEEGASWDSSDLGTGDAYLEYLYHPSTLCDHCVTPISGKWYRCATCSSSFDLCSACHHSLVGHPRDHIFVAFKSQVDMQLFRELTSLSESSCRPLISQPVYLPASSS